jgi:hypothetical protein
MALHKSTRNLLLNAARERKIEFVKCVLQNLIWADLTEGNIEKWDNSEAGGLLQLEDDDLLNVLCHEGASSVLTQNGTACKPISQIDVLHYAVQNNELAAVTYLLELGIVRACKKLDGEPPLSRCRSVEMATLLLKHGADIEGEDREGNTSLACDPDIEIAELLLFHRADANAINHNGETVLNRAAWRRRSDLVALLIEHGAVAWSYNTKANNFIVRLFMKHLRYLEEKEVTLRSNFVSQARVLALSILSPKKGYKRYCAIREMLRKRRFRETLLELLQCPVLVDCEEAAIGRNVRWNLRLRADTARDKHTGQKLDLTQIMFKQGVTVYISQDLALSPKSQLRVRGSVGQVFNDIQRNLQSLLSLCETMDQSRTVWFCKLSLVNEGTYELHVSIE